MNSTDILGIILLSMVTLSAIILLYKIRDKTISGNVTNKYSERYVDSSGEEEHYFVDMFVRHFFEDSFSHTSMYTVKMSEYDWDRVSLMQGLTVLKSTGEIISIEDPTVVYIDSMPEFYIDLWGYKVEYIKEK